MEKEEQKQKTQHAEDRLWSNFSEKLSTMQTSNSRLFYVTIAILNIFILAITMLVLNSKEKVESVSIVFENIGIKNILLLVLMFFAIMVLKTLPDYLKVFSKTKKRKFINCFVANARKEYFDCVTVFSKGEVAYSDSLINGKIKTSHAIDVVTSKNFTNKISFTVYSLLFLIIGAFSWVKYMPIYLYIIALLIVVVNIAYIGFVVYFSKNKEEAMALIGSFCKFLYNRKLIKNYEKTFYSIVDKMIVYNKVFKYSKIIVWTEIFINVLVYFIKGLAIYLLCYSINMVEGGILFQVIFTWCVMEVILNFWPLQKGTLIFELVFISLFRVYYMSGFVFWALLLYRIFDYFMYILQYSLVAIFSKIGGKKRAIQ